MLSDPPGRRAGETVQLPQLLGTAGKHRRCPVHSDDSSIIQLTRNPIKPTCTTASSRKLAPPSTTRRLGVRTREVRSLSITWRHGRGWPPQGGLDAVATWWPRGLNLVGTRSEPPQGSYVMRRTRLAPARVACAVAVAVCALLAGRARGAQIDPERAQAAFEAGHELHQGNYLSAAALCYDLVACGA